MYIGIIFLIVVCWYFIDIFFRNFIKNEKCIFVFVEEIFSSCIFMVFLEKIGFLFYFYIGFSYVGGGGVVIFLWVGI